MSFITKRERVFSDAEEGDLPSRNEGKLKAYKSCTDTRAWSHYLSDKSEHLFDMIKRNNGTCPPKLIPTGVIVDTLLRAKNAEIARLKRRIAEFEQLIAAYDIQLELTCEQRCQMARAHEAIKVANMEMEELFLDLSETEWSDDEHGEGGAPCTPATCAGLFLRPLPPAANMCAPSCQHKCTNTSPSGDPRLLQEEMISKDAKLSAMQNTIEILESDVCEPYCVYAHVYTALERIFGILKQSPKYRAYLDAFMPTQNNADIKGKILYKLKVLEAFCGALTSTCGSKACSINQNANDRTTQQILHACVLADLSFISNARGAGTGSESENSEWRSSEDLSYNSCSSSEQARSKLITEIIDNENMMEALTCVDVSRPISSAHSQEWLSCDFSEHDVEKENLIRLRQLQACYAEMLLRYEDLQAERNDLQDKVATYDDIESELELLRFKLKEYSVLWNEKEHFRRRSDELDSLKELFLTLSDEASEYKSLLKAECEINESKSVKVMELTNENIALENHINDVTIQCEKEKNILQCKLKEMECQVICKDQHIKSLLKQIEQLIEQDEDKSISTNPTEQSSNGIFSLNRQLDKVKTMLSTSEEENERLRDRTKEVEELREMVDLWRKHCEQVTNHSKELDSKYCECKNELERYKLKNPTLKEEIEKDTTYSNKIRVEDINLFKKIDVSSEICDKKDEMLSLYNNYNMELESKYNEAVQDAINFRKEKEETLKLLELSQQDCSELLEKLKTFSQMVHEYEEIKSYNNHLLNLVQTKTQDIERLKNELKRQKEVEAEIVSLHSENTILLNRLQETKKQSLEMKENYSKCEIQDDKYELLKKEHELLTAGIILIQGDLINKSDEINRLINNLESKTEENKRICTELELLKVRMSKSEFCMNFQNISKNSIEGIKLFQKESSQIYVHENASQQTEIEEDSLKNANNKILDENDKLKLDLSKLKDDFVSMSAKYNNIILENDKLRAKLKDYECINANLESKINLYREMENGLIELKDSSANLNEIKEVIDINQAELERILYAKKDIESYSASLQKLEELENALAESKMEKISTTIPTNVDFEKIIDEVELLKTVNKRCNDQLTDLLNKLDDSETLILKLTEDLLSRDNNISFLENYIKKLEDEIRSLQHNLKEAVESGEQMSTGYQKDMENSLSLIQAHHSKAAQNMKMEIANIQKIKTDIEKELSLTKISLNENLKHKEYLYTQISNLRNENNEIINEVQQLEISTMGHSQLDIKEGNLQLVRKSFERVSEFLESRNSKAMCLEQTLQKVQTSSQLLLNKADEAKKILEKEKYKIIKEKEDALRDKNNLEIDFVLKEEKLEQQISSKNDKIRDLESEIANQKLLINEINCSAIHVNEQKKELIHLQNAYQDSSSKLSELMGKNVMLQNNMERLSEIVERRDKKIKLQSIQIADLMSELNKINTKVPQSAIQSKDKGVQTNSGYTFDLQKNAKFLHNHFTIDQTANNLTSPIRDGNNIINFGTRTTPLDALSRKYPQSKYSSPDLLSLHIKERDKQNVRHKSTSLCIATNSHHKLEQQSLTEQNEGDIISHQTSKDVEKSVKINSSKSLEAFITSLPINNEIKNSCDLKTNEYELIDIYHKPPKDRKLKTMQKSDVLVMEIDYLTGDRIDSENESHLQSNSKRCVVEDATNPMIFQIFNDSKDKNQLSDKSQSKCLEDKTVQTSPISSKFSETTYIQSISKLEDEIKRLKFQNGTIEKKCDDKIFAMKIQYDTNVHHIISEHNEGINNIQSLHEETLKDIIKKYENEIQSLKVISLEGSKGINIFEKQNDKLKSTFLQNFATSKLILENVSSKYKNDPKTENYIANINEEMRLSKTKVEAFEVKPKRQHGLCTCIDIFPSQTFCDHGDKNENKDRRLAEKTYLKFIASKLLDGGVTEVKHCCKGSRCDYGKGLTFHDHISNICKTSYRTPGFVMRQAYHLCSIKAIKVLYNAFMRSKLESNAITWNQREAKYALMVEEVQKILEAAELAFLHGKVCHAWKKRFGRRDPLLKKIAGMEQDLMRRQQHAHKHISQLETAVHAETRRLQEVRTAAGCACVDHRRCHPPPPPQPRVESTLAARQYEYESLEMCYNEPPTRLEKQIILHSTAKL